MPTENRSSNTEMVSVPEGFMLVERSIWTEKQVDAATACITRLKGVPTMTDRALAMAAIDAAQCTAPDIALSDLLLAPQPHPEPIAWMVGTAIWWTREEAERDAAATGLPIVGLGPMAVAASGEQHQDTPVGEVVAFGKGLHEIAWAAGRMPGLGAKLYTHADPGEVKRLRSMFDQTDADLRSVTAERDTLRAEADRLRGENEDLRSQLGAEISKSTGLRTLADGANKWRQRAIDSQLAARDLTDANNELHAKLAERDALLDRVVDHAKFWHDHPYAEVVEGIAKDYKALSASAVPSAPTPQTINGHKLNCKAVDDYKPGYCSCGAEPDSKS